MIYLLTHRAWFSELQWLGEYRFLRCAVISPHQEAAAVSRPGGSTEALQTDLLTRSASEAQR